MPIYISIRHIAYPTPDKEITSVYYSVIINNTYFPHVEFLKTNTDYIRKLKYFILCLNHCFGTVFGSPDNMIKVFINNFRQVVKITQLYNYWLHLLLIMYTSNKLMTC